MQVTLMSNVTAINQMLEDIKLKEEKTKQAVLEATQAGNDIFVKVAELKEMTMLSTEENDKVVHITLGVLFSYFSLSYQLKQ